MKIVNITRIAQSDEWARYEDDTWVHCGLATDPDDNIYEGVDHKALYEERKAAGEWPYRLPGLMLAAVKQHSRQVAVTKAHWRLMSVDVERVLNGMTDYHKMAQDAVVMLLGERRIKELARDGALDWVEYGGCKVEKLTKSGRKLDVGAWDRRYPDDLIAFEITYTSGQSLERVKELEADKVLVYERNIRQWTLDAVKSNIIPDVDFYAEKIKKSGFRRINSEDFEAGLSARYLKLKEAEDAARVRAAIKEKQRLADLEARREREERQRQAEIERRAKVAFELQRKRDAQRREDEAKRKAENAIKEQQEEQRRAERYAQKLAAEKDRQEQLKRAQEEEEERIRLINEAIAKQNAKVKARIDEVGVNVVANSILDMIRSSDDPESVLHMGPVQTAIAIMKTGDFPPSEAVRAVHIENAARYYAARK